MTFTILPPSRRIQDVSCTWYKCTAGRYSRVLQGSHDLIIVGLHRFGLHLLGRRTFSFDVVTLDIATQRGEGPWRIKKMPSCLIKRHIVLGDTRW